MSKAKFEAAREFIKEGHYKEARVILQTIDHPLAKDWLQKIDKRSPARSIPNAVYIGGTGIILILIMGGALIYTQRNSIPLPRAIPGTSMANSIQTSLPVLTSVPPTTVPVLTLTPPSGSGADTTINAFRYGALCQMGTDKQVTQQLSIAIDENDWISIGKIAGTQFSCHVGDAFISLWSLTQLAYPNTPKINSVTSWHDFQLGWLSAGRTLQP